MGKVECVGCSMFKRREASIRDQKDHREIRRSGGRREDLGLILEEVGHHYFSL